MQINMCALGGLRRKLKLEFQVAESMGTRNCTWLSGKAISALPPEPPLQFRFLILQNFPDGVT